MVGLLCLHNHMSHFLIINLLYIDLFALFLCRTLTNTNMEPQIYNVNWKKNVEVQKHKTERWEHICGTINKVQTNSYLDTIFLPSPAHRFTQECGATFLQKQNPAMFAKKGWHAGGKEGKGGRRLRKGSIGQEEGRKGGGERDWEGWERTRRSQQKEDRRQRGWEQCRPWDGRGKERGKQRTQMSKNSSLSGSQEALSVIDWENEESDLCLRPSLPFARWMFQDEVLTSSKTHSPQR